MAKIIITASIDESTMDKVQQTAQKEDRSFSKMVDMLLAESIIRRELNTKRKKSLTKNKK